MMDWLEFVRKIQDLEKRLGAQERLDRPVPVGVVTRYSGTPAANAIAYWGGAGTVAGDRTAYINSGGSVGIGTASPSAALHVIAPAVSSSKETISKFTVSDVTTTFMIVFNDSATNATFAPAFGGYVGNAARPSFSATGFVNSTQDSGTVAAVRLRAQVTSDQTDPPNGTASALTVKPVMDVYNDTSLLMQLQASGLLLLGGLTSGGASQIGVKAGTSSNDAAVGGVLYVDSGTFANSSTGETDLASYSVPANTLAVNNQFLYFKAWGTFASNANSKTIKAKFGAASHTVFTGITAGGSWSIEGYIIRTGAATQDFMAEGQNTISAPGFVGVGTAAETLSGAVTLKLTGQGGATNDVKQEGFIVEYGDKNT